MAIALKLHSTFCIEFDRVKGRTLRVKTVKVGSKLVCLSLALSFRERNEPRYGKNLSSGFSTRLDTNRAVQPQKIARGLKFRI